MSTDEPINLDQPKNPNKLCHCGKPRPAHELLEDYQKCRRDHQQPKRELYLMDRLITSSGSSYEPHQHKPGHLGMLLQGPSPNNLMIDRAQMSLCTECHLVYWTQLEPLPPKSIIER